MAEQSERPKLLGLFFVFARISAVTIGGGYVMFPLLKSEVVDSKGWISAGEMADYYALGQSVPGIIAINTATLVGYRKRGIPGALAAAAGMAAPSLGIILLVAAFLTPWFAHPWVQKAFSGIRAAVVALLAMAVWQVAQKSVRSLAKAAIAVGSFLAIVGLNAHPVLMIVAGGLLGSVLFRKEAEA
ncbi:MAG: chromate transporter [Verrucomicrobiota bacterium]|nr:chromate transporter [Verrucomicrobiota bacterium]